MSDVSWCCFVFTMIFSCAAVVAGFNVMEGFCAGMCVMTVASGLAMLANY